MCRRRSCGWACAAWGRHVCSRLPRLRHPLAASGCARRPCWASPSRPWVFPRWRRPPPPSAIRTVRGGLRPIVGTPRAARTRAIRASWREAPAAAPRTEPPRARRSGSEGGRRAAWLVAGRAPDPRAVAEFGRNGAAPPTERPDSGGGARAVAGRAADPRRKLFIRRTGLRPSAALRERQVAAVSRVLRKTSVASVLGKGWATGSFRKNHLNMGGRLSILPEAKSHMQPLC
jgi:hypothetical protein